MTERMTAAQYQRAGFPGAKGKRRVTPETSIKRAVKQWLDVQGWTHVHLLAAGMGVYPGLPDMLALRQGRLVCLEIKAPGGRLSSAQEAFRDMWQAAGGEYVVARSIDDLEEAGMGGRQECLR